MNRPQPVAGQPVISAHYAEIALKGKNRGVFQRRLRNNMMAALAGEPVLSCNHVESRYLVRLSDPAAAERVADKLGRVFGIQWLSVSETVPRTGDPERDVERVGAAAAAKAAADLADVGSFKVKTRRSDRDFPLDSPEISRRVGGAVQDATGLAVRLTDPEATIHVLVLKDEILIFSRKRPGGGGLPFGASGKLMCLLSGGIDSPVAAWMMMKRGCRPHFVHFHVGRSLAEADVGKIERIAMGLARWSPKPLRITMVPVVPYEMRAVGTVDDSLDMVLFRRFMVKTAERLAYRRGCHALVTGDSVGQVASQTLPNLRAISPDVTLPILRPLVGLDKIEITAFSQRIGVFEASIEPYRDCCSIRSPKPELNAKPEVLAELSQRIGLSEAVTEAVRTSAKLLVGPQGRIED
ncbi:tRNA 4-thiouridine(8) synthase ThiI [bacterium]|nr:tRNA 4-thiouridine(8) synthase ThiI [bacterium]